MDSARYVGRVSGLAAVLGVGAAAWLCLGLGVAQADADSRAPGTASAESGPMRSARTGPAHRAVTREAHTDRFTAAMPSPNPTAAARRTLNTASRRLPQTTSRAKTSVAVRPHAEAQSFGIGTTAPVSIAPVSIAPVAPTLSDGIINGTISAADANGYALAYTVVDGPANGGKVAINSATGRFAYLPDLAALKAGATESFSVLASEQTPFVVALENLINLPEVTVVIQRVLATLYQTPVVNVLLSPLIGWSALTTVSVDTGTLVPSPADTPVAYTVEVTSFDGTAISANFFPAAGLQADQTAPTVFTGAGLAAPGQTDPYLEWDPSIHFVNLAPGPAPLRAAGYNVVSWDSRGQFASGGTLELDSPAYEGRDVSALIDYFVAQERMAVDEVGNPLIGMTGGSYGGGIQLVAALLDDRIDALVPGIAWNTLTESLYPARSLNALWGATLAFLLLAVNARVNPLVYEAVITGLATSDISPAEEALLARTGPGLQAAEISTPTLLIQGTADTVFPLNQAVINAELIGSTGTPVKMIWYCGGHGVCLNPANPNQDALIRNATLEWLDQYVKGQPPQPQPAFRWIDQSGTYFSSELMPFDAAFAGRSITATGPGGVMPILAALGGGGPSLVSPVLSLLATAPAINAVNLTIPTSPTAGTTQIVGSPQVTFTYAGLGNATAVYAQIVDDTTGKVLGNAVTPIPVILDGQTRTVDLPMQSIAYTAQPGSSLTLQVTNTALPFLNTGLGVIDVHHIEVSLPTVASGIASTLD